MEKAEMMTAFRANSQPNADRSQSPSFPVRFREDRALWRESETLLNGMVGQEGATRPKVLEVLAKRTPAGMSNYTVVPLMVAGVINDQKLVVNWSQDTLAVSPQLLQLQDDGLPGALFSALRDALQFAETMGTLLMAKKNVTFGLQTKPRWSPMLVLAMEYAKGLGDRTPQPKDYAAIADHLDSRRDYWAALALPFHTFLGKLAATDEASEAAERTTLGQQWLAAVQGACKTAFQKALDRVDNAGESQRALRAISIAGKSFEQCCAIATKDYQQTWEGDEE